MSIHGVPPAKAPAVHVRAVSVVRAVGVCGVAQLRRGLNVQCWCLLFACVRLRPLFNDSVVVGCILFDAHLHVFCRKQNGEQRALSVVS